MGKIKKILGGIIIVISVTVGAFMGALPWTANSAHAAPSISAKSIDARSISLTIAGDTYGPLRSSDGAIFTGQVPLVQGTVNNNPRCGLFITITTFLTNPTGLITAVPRKIDGAAIHKEGDTPPPNVPACSQSVATELSGKTIPVDKGSSTVESPGSKKINATSLIPWEGVGLTYTGLDAIDATKAPATDTLTLKYVSGSTFMGPIATQTKEASRTKNSDGVIYKVTFDNVAAGTYSLCSVVTDSCIDVVKEPAEIGNFIIEATEGKYNIVADEPVEEAQKCRGGTGVMDGFLGFIVCPFTEMILRTTDWLQNTFIIPFLAVSPLGIGNNAVFEFWKIFRDISYVFLVVAFMYLVFAQTTSFGGEAYQLKRLAPRLVLVTIGISLSYYMIGFVIDFFNILGSGIASITQYMLSRVDSGSLVVVEGGASALGLMGLTLSIGVGGVLLALTSGVISGASIGIAALAGVAIVLGVVMTLLIRQVLILVLTIMTPLALVASLLPNTEKFTKMWWSYLTKALVMYPLIIILFAGGKLVGALISTGQFTGGNSSLASLMSFMANIAPLVLVPFTFKMAGGAIGGFYGAMRGAVSKGRNAAMGDPHNPNSVRGRRAESAGNWSRRLNRAATKLGGSNSKLLRYSGAAGASRLAAKGLRLQERAAMAEKEQAEKARSIVHDVDDAVHKQVVLGDEGISKEELEAQGLSNTQAQEVIDAFDHTPKTENRVAAQGLRSRWGVRKEAYASFGAKHGGNTARVAQVRAALQRDVENETIDEDQANVLWTSFAKGAKEAGKGAALDNMRGADGRKETAWKKDLTIDQASSSTRTLKDHVTDMHGSTDVERWSDHDWKMIELSLGNEELMQDPIYRSKILNLAQKASEHVAKSHMPSGDGEPELAEEGGGIVGGRGYGLNLDKIGIMKRIAEKTEAARGVPPPPTPPSTDTDTDTDTGFDPRGYV